MSAVGINQYVKNSVETNSQRARWSLLATSLGFGVVQLDVSVVNVAIRPIGNDLGASTSDMQWVVSAYTIAFAALILSAGALGDRLGAKRIFLSGFGLFTLASAVCGLAPNLAVLVAARAIQGIGAAVLVPCSLALLTHAYPDAEVRSKAIGFWAAGAAVTLSAGPLVGGVLTSVFGWRAIFFINAPVGIFGLWLTLRFVTDTTQSTDRSLDGLGQVLTIVALTSLAAATIEGGEYGFLNEAVLGGFLLALVSFATFVVYESRTAKPMLPMHFFKNKKFSSGSAIGLVVNIAFYGLIFVLSLYFQSIRHYSALMTGLAFAPMTVTVFAGNISAGRIAKHKSGGFVIALGAILSVVSLTALLITNASTPYWAMTIQFIVLGYGLGLIVPAMTTAVLSSVDKTYAGVAAGTLNTARQTGSVIGVATFGALTTNGLVNGLHLALGTAAVLGVVVVILGLTANKGPVVES